MSSLTVGILILLMTASPVLRSAWGNERERIVILPFTQQQADSSLEYLEDALPALLTVAISGSGESHAVVERRQVNALLAEQSLTLSGLTSTETRQRVGKLLGATVMITGSFVRQDEQLLVSIRASDLETGIVVGAVQGLGTIGRPNEVVSDLYRRLAGELVDRRLPDLASAPIDDAPLANLHFMKGLGHFHSARYSLALAEFMLAAEDSQVTEISRLWLAHAYMAQQQYAHAYLELSRLASSGPEKVPASDVAALMRTCEQHLSAEDLKVARELVASPVLVTVRPDPSEPLRFLGGRTVSLPLLIHSPEGEGLTVRAQLVQLTTRLAVPVSAEIDVPLPAHSADASRIEVELAVPLPSVERETDFELRFRSFRSRDRIQRAAGRIALRVYPARLPVSKTPPTQGVVR